MSGGLSILISQVETCNLTVIIFNRMRLDFMRLAMSKLKSVHFGVFGNSAGRSETPPDLFAFTAANIATVNSKF